MSASIRPSRTMLVLFLLNDANLSIGNDCWDKGSKSVVSNYIPHSKPFLGLSRDIPSSSNLSLSQFKSTTSTKICRRFRLVKRASWWSENTCYRWLVSTGASSGVQRLISKCIRYARDSLLELEGCARGVTAPETGRGSKSFSVNSPEWSSSGYGLSSFPQSHLPCSN